MFLLELSRCRFSLRLSGSFRGHLWCWSPGLRDLLVSFLGLEQTVFLFQFQMVADLFLDKDDAPPSSKPSRVNVRALKPSPKAPNKEHRKSVGLQVSWQVLRDPEPSGVWI